MDCAAKVSTTWLTAFFGQKTFAVGAIYCQLRISNSVVTLHHQPTPAVISPFAVRALATRRHCRMPEGPGLKRHKLGNVSVTVTLHL
jgi:hypothetical protein